MKRPACLLPLAILAASALAQPGRGGFQPPAPPTPADWEDPTGTYDVVMETDEALPGFTIYRPANLAPFPDRDTLPIVIMSGPGCNYDGDTYRPFWTEVASHGYLMIGVGPPAAGGVSQPWINDADDYLAALDWAFAESERSGSPYEGKIDTGQVALYGQSCGGIQALRIADDPRVTTLVFWNSGSILMGNVGPTDNTKRLNTDSDLMGSRDLKVLLNALTIPVAWFVGDTDMARPRALDDFEDIGDVPAFMAVRQIPGDSHGGTFREKNGGGFGLVGVRWLDWITKGDQDAGQLFRNETALPASDPAWIEVRTKNTAAAQQARVPQVQVDPDGTVHLPAQAVPVSSFMSPEGQAYLVEHLLAVRQPQTEIDGIPSLLVPYLERQWEIFAVDREDTELAGVHAYVYTPRAGIARENRDRVLIDLHGGGFSGCWPACAELESMPIAALGRIRVISLDYRQGPEHRHPAASEDVAAVYRSLLEEYRPGNIGLYGCSAGGMLAAMSVAWFREHELPRPGAIGILCAGAAAGGTAFGGDANYTAMPLGEGRAATPPPANAAPASSLGYFAGTDADDPLVNPASSSEVLGAFPPTLIITGTRAFELSNAVHTHAQLVKLGVDARLHVWEGMFHGFFYNPDVPESREAFDVIVDFFAAQLGSH